MTRRRRFKNDPELRSIEALDLPRRAMNCFLNENVKTVGEMCSLQDKELLRFPDFGLGTLKSLRKYMASAGLPVKPCDSRIFKPRPCRLIDESVLVGMIDTIKAQKKTISDQQRLLDQTRQKAVYWRNRYTRIGEEETPIPLN